MRVGHTKGVTGNPNVDRDIRVPLAQLLRDGPDGECDVVVWPNLAVIADLFGEDSVFESLVHAVEAVEERARIDKTGIKIGKPFAELGRAGALEGDNNPVGVTVPEQSTECATGVTHLGHGFIIDF